MDTELTDDDCVVVTYDANGIKQRETKAGKKCPKCEAWMLNERVKRAWYFKLFLFWLPFKRYRCDACSKKSYVYGQYARKKKHPLHRESTLSQ